MSWLQPLQHQQYAGLGHLLMERIENFLYCGRSYKEVVWGGNGVYYVRDESNNESGCRHFLKTAAKIAVYCTVVIPLICLAIKAIYRCNITIIKYKAPKPIPIVPLNPNVLNFNNYLQPRNQPLLQPLPPVNPIPVVNQRQPVIHSQAIQSQKDPEGIEHVLARLQDLKREINSIQQLSSLDREWSLDYIQLISFFGDPKNLNTIKRHAGYGYIGNIGDCRSVNASTHGGKNEIYIHFDEYQTWEQYEKYFQALAGQFLFNYELAEKRDQLHNFLQEVSYHMRSGMICLEGKSTSIQQWVFRNLLVEIKPLHVIFPNFVGRIYLNEEHMFAAILESHKDHLTTDGKEEPLTIEVLRKYYDDINKI